MTQGHSNEEALEHAHRVYKFGVSQKSLDTVKATLPLVAKAGTDFTKHFYKRMFTAHPELQNVFNQTSQFFSLCGIISWFIIPFLIWPESNLIFLVSNHLLYFLQTKPWEVSQRSC